MRSRACLGILALSCLLVAASAANPLAVELLSEQRSIRPGADFCLGLMGSARRDDNVYMTLHDHFIQTGVLRKRIAELDKASK